MSGVTTAVIAGAVVAAGVGGAAIAANAAENAGNAQINAQNRALGQQISERDRLMKIAMDSARMSPGEVAALGRLINTRMTGLNAELASVSSQLEALGKIDPQIQESGKQTLELLRGQSSRYLTPVMEQRDRQRARLENQLASQLGPGFRTSTAGMEALTRFDEETNLVTAQVQQQALHEVSGMFSSFFGQQQNGQANATQAIGNAYSRAGTLDATALQAEQYATSRMTNAALGAAGASPINFQGPAQVAGLPFQSGEIWGQGIAGAGQGIGSIFGQYQGMQYAGAQNNKFLEAMKAGGTGNVSPIAPQVPSVSQAGYTGQTMGSMFGNPNYGVWGK